MSPRLWKTSLPCDIACRSTLPPRQQKHPCIRLLKSPERSCSNLRSGSMPLRVRPAFVKLRIVRGPPQSGVMGQYRRLNTISGMKFLHDVGHVMLHRFLADPQVITDLLVDISGSHALEYLTLPLMWRPVRPPPYPVAPCRVETTPSR